MLIKQFSTTLVSFIFTFINLGIVLFALTLYIFYFIHLRNILSLMTNFFFKINTRFFIFTTNPPPQCSFRVDFSFVGYGIGGAAYKNVIRKKNNNFLVFTQRRLFPDITLRIKAPNTGTNFCKKRDTFKFQRVEFL